MCWKGVFTPEPEVGTHDCSHNLERPTISISALNLACLQAMTLIIEVQRLLVIISRFTPFSRSRAHRVFQDRSRMLLIASCGLLSVDIIWRVASWFLKFSLIATLMTIVLLVTLASFARLFQWRTLKYLRHLPGKREVVPFLNQWILTKACTQQGSPVGPGTCKF